VYRVLSRVFGIATPIDSTAGRKEFRELAGELISHQHPGDHNQAVMELGATVCAPRNPRCNECPLVNKCIARAEGRIAELPVKAGKTKVRSRHFNYLLVEAKGGLYLRKRTGKDIWQGLWELPMIETEKAMTARSFPAALRKAHGAGWTILGHEGPVKHVLSHQVIQALFWKAAPPNGFEPPADWTKVSPATLDRHGLPRLVERHLAEWAEAGRP
jgi:A/G-specific adenine glycosylase